MEMKDERETEQARFPTGKVEDWWLKEQGIEIEFVRFSDTGSNVLRIGPREIVYGDGGEWRGSGVDLTKERREWD